MVSGAGMMDFESCQSLEKLVLDAEIIGMAKRLLAGIERRDDPIALTLMRQLGHRADYLGQEHTLRWFQQEFYIPSAVIERGSLDAWRGQGGQTAFDRARDRVEALLASHQPRPVPVELQRELHEITLTAARQFGMDELPAFPLKTAA